MVCKDSPSAIALDEELIGAEDSKEALLKKIKPQFLILKPTLHGGFTHCSDWIAQAIKRETPWWATSALESNVGLFHIALWLSNFDIHLPQGLGTGALFKENFDRPFSYQKDLFTWK